MQNSEEEIFKKNKLDQNWKTVRGPVLIGGLSAILLKIEPSYSDEYIGLILYCFICLIVFLVVSFRAIFRYQYKAKDTFLIGAFAGGLFGLLLAFYRLIEIHKVWTVFNLVGEPVLMGIVGGMVVSLFGLIFLKINNK